MLTLESRGSYTGEGFFFSAKVVRKLIVSFSATLTRELTGSGFTCDLYMKDVLFAPFGLAFILFIPNRESLYSSSFSALLIRAIELHLDPTWCSSAVSYTLCKPVALLGALSDDCRSAKFPKPPVLNLPKTMGL